MVTSPLWQKLFKLLLTQIETGELHGAIAFPSEKQLCQMHGVSRITVRRALRELELLGLLQRHRGSGSVVVPPASHCTPRNIHVVMTPDGHVLHDLHQALMLRLGELSFSHQTWVPVHGAMRLEELVATPAHGTILVPWHMDMVPFQQQASLLGRCVSLVPDSGTGNGFPGIGIDLSHPIKELLALARKLGIQTVFLSTYQDVSQQHVTVSEIVSQECQRYQQKNKQFTDFDTGADEEFAAIFKAFHQTNEPVLVLCASDFIAATLQKCVRQAGKRVPQDIAIVGIYDTPWSQAGDISTISVRPIDLVDAALHLIITERTNMSFTKIPGRLIIRSSGPGPAP